jgi:sialate O-acetylesterase
VLHVDHGGGLASRDGKPLTWFTIAGEDGKFVPADAVIEREHVVVRSDAVKAPKAVRFAWDEEAQPNLVNGAGLPALPFRTDRPD